MKKTILTILLFGVMLLGITGCGNNSDSFSAEDKKQIISEIESYIETDRKTVDSNGYKNSYEVTVTDIQKEGLNVTFSGDLYIKYPDDSENRITFTGSSSLKSNPYSIYNTEIDYNY